MVDAQVVNGTIMYNEGRDITNEALQRWVGIIKATKKRHQKENPQGLLATLHE